MKTYLIFQLIMLLVQPLFGLPEISIDFNKNSVSQLNINFVKNSSDNSLILKNFRLLPGDIKFTSENESISRLIESTPLKISELQIDFSAFMEEVGEFTITFEYTGTETQLPEIFKRSKSFDIDFKVSDESIELEPNPSEIKYFGPSEIMKGSRNKLLNDPNYNFIKYYNNELGIYLEKNVVHIFLDQNGNFIEAGLPTTSTEKYIYQFHLFQEQETLDEISFRLSYEGKFTPTFNIERGGELISDAGQSGKLKKNEPIMIELPFEKIGPFTDNFKVKIERIDKEGNTEKVLIDRTIQVAKLFHVSISTGLISTTLRNPQNIQTFALPNGDSTLVADDPSLRGVVTLFATFYPKGRSFLLTPSGNLFDPSRFAIQVGAQLNNNLAENFFLGLSHDFARGGSISYGTHFGRRNYVAGKPDFKFGSEKFDLNELVIKKDWNIGFYFGVVIDVRVAFQLLGSIGNPQF